MYWDGDLVNKYFFSRLDDKEVFIMGREDGVSSEWDGVYHRKIIDYWNINYIREDGKFVVHQEAKENQEGKIVVDVTLKNKETNTIILSWTDLRADECDVLYFDFDKSKVVVSRLKTVKVYTRAITDVSKIDNITLKPIPEDDMAGSTYKYVYPVKLLGEDFIISQEMSESPTEYGKFPDKEYYYAKPKVNGNITPVCRSQWREYSIWLKTTTAHGILESKLSTTAIVKDAYKLSTVINELLLQIAKSKEITSTTQIIKHEATSEYSQFLYGNHNLFGNGVSNPTLLITQKTNMLNNYDAAATKTPITLGEILKMLKVSYDCDWFIEGGDKLRIEHSEFFKRGGTYDKTDDIIDLTQLICAKNSKSWDFGSSVVEYEKVQMPERYKFKWHDDVSSMFNGYELEVQSRFVSRGKTEEYSAGNFTSDIDYMFLNPSNISKDGYVLLGANKIYNEDKYKVLYYNVDNAYLQNGHLSFSNLLNYLTFNMPSKNITVNGVAREANGTLYGRTSIARFPVVSGLTTTSRIKTSIGIGIIEKFSVNLCSDMVNATIKYDTYE